MIALIEAPPNGIRGQVTHPLWRKIIALLGRNSDQRHLEQLKMLGKKPIVGFEYSGLNRLFAAEREPALEQALAFTPQAAGPRNLSPIELAVQALAPEANQAQMVAELEAEICANPDDEGVRAVLADVLNDLGDPRGELIVLQLQKQRTREQNKRIRTLLAGHQRKWLGRLEPAARKTGVEYEGGFVCAIRMSLDVDLDTIIGLPELNLLTAIDLRQVLQRQDELVGGLKRLRAITGASATLVSKLEHPLLEELEVRYAGANELEQLSVAKFPALRRLRLLMTNGDAEHFAPLWKPTHVGAQLDSLDVTSQRFSSARLLRGWIERSQKGNVPPKLTVTADHYLALRITIAGSTVSVESQSEHSSMSSFTDVWVVPFRGVDLSWISHLTVKRFWPNSEEANWVPRVSAAFAENGLRPGVLVFAGRL